MYFDLTVIFEMVISFAVFARAYDVSKGITVFPIGRILLQSFQNKWQAVRLHQRSISINQ